MGLRFDWITGNLYAYTRFGFVLACDADATRNFRCVEVLNALGTPGSITLDPASG